MRHAIVLIALLGLAGCFAASSTDPFDVFVASAKEGETTWIPKEMCRNHEFVPVGDTPGAAYGLTNAYANDDKAQIAEWEAARSKSFENHGRKGFKIYALVPVGTQVTLDRKKEDRVRVIITSGEFKGFEGWIAKPGAARPKISNPTDTKE